MPGRGAPYDCTEIVRDEHGKPVTRWDGRTFKKHPVTGRDVPDETARVEIKSYINPRPATWPDADFLVGNPPYIGGKDIRAEFGEGYAKALWRTYAKMPNRPTSSCIGGTRRRRWCVPEKQVTSGSSPQTASHRRSAGGLSRAI